MSKKNICSALFFILTATSCMAQGGQLGIPPIWNFTKKTYAGGTQNWDALQNHNGVLYFANNEGLLQYDGYAWTCFPVANKTVVRSIAIHPDGAVYAGAQSEMGYFYPAANGRLQYHSLVHLLPAGQQQFEDVWDIQFWNGQVFFRTNQVVFQFDGRQMIRHEPGGALTALFATRHGLLLQQNNTRLLEFTPTGFQPRVQFPDLGSAITGAIPWKADTVLFSSLKNGFYYLTNTQSGIWNTADDAVLRAHRMYAATALPGHKIALGTSLSGLMVLDEHRRITRRLTKNDGLQNNNILCTFADRAGNLWLGLDSGIDCVVLESAFSTIVPDGDLRGTGYAAAVFDNNLYLGVSNGVYQLPWNGAMGQSFTKLPATDGQVWSLENMDGQLLLGHHEGAFRLQQRSATSISTEPGAWTFVQLTPDYMLGGVYDGLVLYRKTRNGWVFDQKLEGLQESCRIMVRDADGSIWVAHPYRGVYRIEWSEVDKSNLKVQFFNAGNGLPSNLNNLVFRVAGRVVVATEKGLMRFNATNNTFYPDTDFNQWLGACGRIRYMKEDLKGNIWYVGEQETGVLEVQDLGLKKAVQKHTYPELTDKLVGGFEFIYPVDDQQVLFGAEQGFIHFDARAKATADTQLQVVLHRVQTSGPTDSTLFFGWFLHQNTLSDTQPASNVPRLTADMNNLRFTFAATDFKDPDFLEYRTMLKGLQHDWSAWGPSREQVYTNLSPDKYTFLVQARRKDGRLSPVVAYSFRITPPWYKSMAALAFYALMGAGAFAAFVYYQRFKFEKEKEQLTERHQQKEALQQLEVEQSKAAVTEIQHEKLQAEIRFNNQELAMATMHLVQKGEILLTVQEHLNKMLEKSGGTAIKKDLQQLLNLLNFDAKLDEDWEQFAFHFDQVHVDFLKRVREQFPQLGINDQKLCAYLRMNLTTKEIAPLMNISVRGVEASRYRLRKKLDLPNDANLTDFMMRV